MSFRGMTFATATLKLTVVIAIISQVVSLLKQSHGPNRFDCHSWTRSSSAKHSSRDPIDPHEHLPAGFTRDPTLKYRPEKPKKPISVTSIPQLKEVIYKGYRVEDIDVRGDTTSSLNETVIHPVVKALHARAAARKKAIENGATPEELKKIDGNKIAVAIEGGGMRGCVAGGMITVSVVHNASCASVLRDVVLEA
jgi:hypothetical protein